MRTRDKRPTNQRTSTRGPKRKNGIKAATKRGSAKPLLPQVAASGETRSERKAPGRGVGELAALLREARQEPTSDLEQARQAMLRRLGAMRRLLWQHFEREPLKAIDRALKIEEREAALLGLDAPARQQTEATLASFDKLSIVALREYLAAPNSSVYLGDESQADDAKQGDDAAADDAKQDDADEA